MTEEYRPDGQYTLLGQTEDADETNDDIALAFLAKQAEYKETIFDLGPLRIGLHRIPSNQRSHLQKRLLYWADSYNAIICFEPSPSKRVTSEEKGKAFYFRASS